MFFIIVYSFPDGAVMLLIDFQDSRVISDKYSVYCRQHQILFRQTLRLYFDLVPHTNRVVMILTEF